MSAIPSSTGPYGGLTRKLDKFDNTNAIGVFGAASLLKPTNVSEYDEVVLNIRCLNNFGSDPLGTYTFATNINIEILYSTVNEFRAPPPIGPPGHGVFWSKILAEALASPFTGATEVAPYSVGIKNIQTNPSILFTGPTTPLNRSIRIPVIMAQWIIPIVYVNTLGTGGGAPEDTWPLVAFSLYRGVTI